MKITVKELLIKQQTTYVNIIDIRSSYAYQKGTILGAKNIPEQDLLYNLDYYLNKNEIYYLLCTNGIKSSSLANLLNTMGYKVYSIIGGYQEYLLEK